MAGIGFAIQKILKKETLSHTIAAYSIAGVISSGPWVISILAILLLGILVSYFPGYHLHTSQFQISITYLIAGSLILTGFVQNSFTRFIADQLFLHKNSKVIPNLNGMTLIQTLITGLLAFWFCCYFFPEQSLLYRFLFMGCFVILSHIWVATNLMAGIKAYPLILLAYFLGYGLAVFLGYILRDFGLEGFMLSFLLGQAILLAILHVALYKQYATESLLAFDFLNRKNLYISLAITGFCYNLGIWIDKFVFWYFSATSYSVIGPLRGSLIYDAPIFLAYLALLPGMAIFLLRMETDFVTYYHQFYSAIRNGQTLTHIRMMRRQMVNYGSSAIHEIIKIQGITVIGFFLFGEQILKLLHISVIYKNLLFIDVIGTSLQVVFLAILNILFYLDRRKETLWLCALFVLLNLIFTTITLYLGPFYYGFGFTTALVCVCMYGTYLLNSEFSDLEYKAIMLNGSQ